MSKNLKITLFSNRVHPVKYRFAVISPKAKLFNGVNAFRRLGSASVRDLLSESIKLSKEALVLMLTGGMLLAPSFFDLRGQQIDGALAEDNSVATFSFNRLPIFQNNTLIPLVNTIHPSPRVIWQFQTIITGYSSTPEETDETPFITASGTEVREGIVAANFVPLGTKIRLPELYDNKIFVVEDRMHARKYYLVDIWFPRTEEALKFGAKSSLVEVLED